MEVKLKNAIEKATESSTDDVEMPVEVKKEGKAEKKDKAEKQRTAKPERRPSVTRSGNHTPTFNVFIAGRDTDRIFPLGSSVHLVEDRPKRGRKPTQKATTMLILDSHVDPDHVDKGTCMFTYVIDNPHHYTGRTLVSLVDSDGGRLQLPNISPGISWNTRIRRKKIWIMAWLSIFAWGLNTDYVGQTI